MALRQLFFKMKKNYIALFLVSFCIYFLGWVLVDYFELNQLKIQSQDAVPTMFVPVAILEHRTLFLDEYYTQMISRYPHPDDKDYKKELVPFYVKKVKDPNTALPHYLSAFPILPALLALPFYLPVIILNIPFSWEVLTILSHVSSAAIVALSGVVFYALLKRHFALSEKKQIIVVLTYLFGSVNFSLSSQALWQHGPLQLFILLCLLFIYERNTFLAGLFLGLSILTRPTAVFMAPFIFLLAVNQIILLSKSSGIGVR
nr:hypothetical protein [Patescibacteria group bacterium]